MKKIYLLTLFLALTGASCSFRNFDTSSQEQADKRGALQDVRTIHLEEETNSFIFSIQYPSFSNDQVLSDLAKEKVLTRKELFEQEVASGDDLTKELGEGFKNGFWVEYNIDTYANKLKTITYTISTYYAGAAHPNTEIMTLVYDLDRQRELAFEDVFEQDKDTMFFISDTIKQDLYRQSALIALEYGTEPITSPNDNFIEDGASPFVKNFRNFVLRDDSVLFLFSPYQVGSYAEGVKKVSIPYATIEPYLLPGIKKQ